MGRRADGNDASRRPWRTALHFALLGALLFVGRRWLLPPPRPVVGVDEARLRRLAGDFERDVGRRPTEPELRVLARNWADDEMLWRDARGRGLDRGDPAISFRLTEKMRFVDGSESPDEQPIDPALVRAAVDVGFADEDAVVRRIVLQKERLLLGRRADAEPLDEDALREHHRLHPERWSEPARVDATQVFFARRGGGDRDAEAILGRLRRGEIAPHDAPALGDPSPLGSLPQGQSERDLAKAWGTDFAARVIALPVGTWEGPIESSQGRHLVLVERRQESRIAPFDAVRATVLADARSERRRERLAAETARLRERHEVRIDERALAAVAGEATGEPAR
ncbi:MAG: peptidyl-prolyl cis-trans isomerase [Alphaproteobacteria bacterium]